MTAKYDIRQLDVLVEVHNRNGTKVVTLPSNFCTLLNINEGNQIRFVVYEIRRDDSIEDLIKLYVKP